MDRKMLHALLPLLLLSLCIGPQVHAQSSVVQTSIFSTAEPGIGHEYRDELKRATTDILAGDAVGSVETTRWIAAYCDAQQRPGRRAISFADTQEYDLYMASHSTGEPTEWIDITCPIAYHMLGFVHAGARRAPQALESLDRAIALAPYFPDAYNERGFVLGQSGRLDESLASYRQALALAEAHPKAAYARPMALRGIGWVLVEMGDLSGAEQAYQHSLDFEPDNDLAKRELHYVDQHSQARPGTDMPAADAPVGRE